MLQRQEIYRANESCLLDLINFARMRAQFLFSDYKKGEARLLTEVAEPFDDSAIKNLTASWQDKHLVLVGIGGSILLPNLFSPFSNRQGTTTYLTAPDSAAIEAVLSSAHIADTRFVILSKSGTTAETMAIFLHVLAWAEEKNISARDIMVAVCEDSANPLRSLCEKHSIPRFNAAVDIDSRFSPWTPLGLLPAALFGLNGIEIRAGAAAYIADFFSRIEKNQPHPLLASAAWTLWGGQTDKNIHVMMYSDKRLRALALWWQQLFAESLGKNGLATTPMCAELPEDLHIRFQLYLDGREDKIFTLLTGCAAKPSVAARALNVYGESKLAWLEGSQLDHLMEGQTRNALNAFERKKRPVRILTLGEFSDRAYGALTAHFALEILLIAKMWDVVAFGQPAIEQGKKDLVAFIQREKYAS